MKLFLHGIFKYRAVYENHCKLAREASYVYIRRFNIIFCEKIKRIIHSKNRNSIDGVFEICFRFCRFFSDFFCLKFFIIPISLRKLFLIFLQVEFLAPNSSIKIVENWRNETFFGDFQPLCMFSPQILLASLQTWERWKFCEDWMS